MGHSRYKQFVSVKLRIVLSNMISPDSVLLGARVIPPSDESTLHVLLTLVTWPPAHLPDPLLRSIIAHCGPSFEVPDL